MTRKGTAAGFRHARFYGVDIYGLPEDPAWGAADTAYNGMHLEGAKALTITVPDAQIITHTGDDGVLGTDMLPPNEAVTGEARTGMTNFDVDALFQNVNVIAHGEMEGIGMSTSQQGLEPDLVLLAYRQATKQGGVQKGGRCWLQFLLPLVQVFTKTAGAEEGAADENTYTVQPRIVSAYPWGIAFTIGVEKFVTTPLIRYFSDFRPHLAVWKGDAAELIFDFTTGFIPATVPKVKVFHWVAATGVSTDVTATVTTTTTAITFAAAPAAGDKVVAHYEIAN